MKQKFDIFLHVSAESWSTGDMLAFSHDMTGFGYHLLCTQTVEIDVPEFDMVKIQVEGIDQQILSIRADSQMQITTLEGRKQELLAIGVDV